MTSFSSTPISVRMVCVWLSPLRQVTRKTSSCISSSMDEWQKSYWRYYWTFNTINGIEYGSKTNLWNGEHFIDIEGSVHWHVIYSHWNEWWIRWKMIKMEGSFELNWSELIDMNWTYYPSLVKFHNCDCIDLTTWYCEEVIWIWESMHVISHCGLVESARTCVGTSREFESWQCRINISWS